MGIDLYQGDGKQFKAYCIEPDVLLEHYVNANIKTRKGSNCWHVVIKSEDGNLALIRRDAPDAFVPIDENNYYTYFEMADEEYRDLKKALPPTKWERAEERRIKRDKVSSQ